MKVFVYGTLKKGFRLHFRMPDDAKLLGKGVTLDRYPLIGQFIPRLLDIKGKGCNVKGELYEVKDVSIIDIVEGHPCNYERKEIPVVVNGEVYEAWVYFSNHWEEYNGEDFLEEYKEHDYTKYH